MGNDSNAGGTTLKVPFTEQQLALLNKVLAEGRYGSTMEEVCRNVFREYAQQYFGREGR